MHAAAGPQSRMEPGAQSESPTWAAGVNEVGTWPRYSEVGYGFPRHNFTCYNKYLPLNDSLLLALHMYGERCIVISTLSHYFDVCMCAWKNIYYNSIAQPHQDGQERFLPLEFKK